MDSRLDRPAPAAHRDAQDLLHELEELDEALRAKLEHAPAAANEKYQSELAPLLHSVRTLVAQRAPRARNAVEDALVRFRELLITSNANVVKAHF
jgi:hypothetical protein